MEMLLNEIANATHGTLMGENLTITAASIDTRTLKKGDLYIAIKGEKFDGHTFVEKAAIAGAKAILVEQETTVSLPQIIVKDSHLALAEFAAAWKEKANVTTVGITGSNGKTTVKEMIAGILNINSSVLFTQGNLNNDIGVPLTLLKLQQENKYAVIEMGANHAGEIEYSSHYAKPDVAVITNVGAAHIEGFGSLQGVAKAKSEIIAGLDKSGTAVLNKDDAFYSVWQAIAGNRKTRTFGIQNDANITAQELVSDIEKGIFFTQFVLLTETDRITVKLKLAGQHNVMNALAATACCLSLGINLQQIKQGLEEISPVTGRLQPLLGIQDSLVIDDSYNANPDSFKVALDVLKQCKGEHWVVLGALGEMGTKSETIHKELGTLIKSKNVARVLAIGSDAEFSVQEFGKGATFFKSHEQLISALKSEIKGGETILIKGSRAQKMEKVVAALVSDFRK